MNLEQSILKAKKFWIEISLIIICTYNAGMKGFLSIIGIIVLGWTISYLLQWRCTMFYIVELLGCQPHIGLVVDRDTGEPIPFLSRREAKMYAQENCAWSYKIINF